jgi:hypothetical protein
VIRSIDARLSKVEREIAAPDAGALAMDTLLEKVSRQTSAGSSESYAAGAHALRLTFPRRAGGKSRSIDDEIQGGGKRG